MAKAKTTTRRRKPAKGEAIAIRDALPFCRKRKGKIPASYWNVTPSDNYSTDLATSKNYARAFLPLLTFNAGASDLAIIVSDMAKAGRDPANNPKGWRCIDNVALGFMMEVGNMLRNAMIGIGIASTALEMPASDLGPKFVELVKGGNVLYGPPRNTLFDDPTARIWDSWRRK